jgi:hypothetical protein
MTGNRRFWPIQVKKPIDLVKLEADRLQLWGEAAHYQSRGESIVLDARLWATAEVEQDARRTRHPWEAILADLSLPAPGLGGIVHRIGNELRVSTVDLFEYKLKVSSGQLHNGHSKLLSEIMRLLGWKSGVFKLEGRSVRGYVKGIMV